MDTSWRRAVFNVVICMLIFSAGFVWPYFGIFFGGVADKHLVLRVMMLVAAIVLAAEALRYAGEGEYCIAALLDVYALLMALGAIFAL